MTEVFEGLVARLARLGSLVARTTAIPLLVRGVVWFAGAAALAIALSPSLLLSGPGLFLLAAAALPAVAPRTPVVTVVMLLPVVGWLATGSVTLWRLVGLASLLYLVHSAAALAGQLPYDAIVSPEVLVRWFARVALVLAATAVLTLYALLAGELLRGRATLVATVLGLAVAVGMAALLARSRPPRDGPPPGPPPG